MHAEKTSPVSNPSSMADSLEARIIGQFKKPSGALGRVAGWIMANRASNIDRNCWTVDLLGLAEAARVLEIGCGPGIGLEAVLRTNPAISAMGLDHSELMIAAAARRNQNALRQGRLKLLQGSLTDLPDDGRFEAVVSCNVLQFIEDRAGLLSQVKSRLVPGGVFATTFQPRGRCASAEDGRQWIGRLAEDLCQAGFQDVDVREKIFGDMPAFCALASTSKTGM